MPDVMSSGIDAVQSQGSVRSSRAGLTWRAASAPGTGTLKLPPPSRHQADPSPLFSTKMSPAIK